MRHPMGPFARHTGSSHERHHWPLRISIRRIPLRRLSRQTGQINQVEDQISLLFRYYDYCTTVSQQGLYRARINLKIRSFSSLFASKLGEEEDIPRNGRHNTNFFWNTKFRTLTYVLEHKIRLYGILSFREGKQNSICNGLSRQSGDFIAYNRTKITTNSYYK